MQATLGIRHLRVLSLVMALITPGCGATTEEASPTAADLSSTTIEITTLAPPTAAPSRTSTTTATTTSTAVTTTTATTTVAPAPTTTEPAELPERSITVPATAPPVIDGVIEPGEWDKAATVTMSNGDSVYWEYTDSTLYVAIDADHIGAVNLVLATPRELWILHSSAALGSQLFTPGDGAWEQVHGYTWCCRSPTNDSARFALLEEEGWQANIGFTGDVGVVEYQVAIPWGYAQAALVYHTEDRDSAYWPDDLTPEDAEHITGNMWTDPELDPSSWLMLIPEQEPESG